MRSNGAPLYAFSASQEKSTYCLHLYTQSCGPGLLSNDRKGAPPGGPASAETDRASRFTSTWRERPGEQVRDRRPTSEDARRKGREQGGQERAGREAEGTVRGREVDSKPER